MSIFNQAAKTILDLARKCPKCGQEQVVPASRKNETVKCKACGGNIAPQCIDK
jgi:ribosomal protein S27E